MITECQLNSVKISCQLNFFEILNFVMLTKFFLEMFKSYLNIINGV